MKNKMCGILGCIREEGITIRDLAEIIGLIRMNSLRGPKAYGIISDRHLIKSTSNPLEINYDILKQFQGDKYIMVHLRAPTGDGQNTLEFTQPFVFEKCTLLFNGILTEWNHHIFKNDTYQVFNYLSKGLEELEKLKGSFALAWKDKKDNISLIRCINSLFYSEHFFSSVKFKIENEKCLQLNHGEILDFKTKKITKFKAYNPYNID